MSIWEYVYNIGSVLGWLFVIIFVLVLLVNHELPSFFYALTTENRLVRKNDRLSTRLRTIEQMQHSRTQVVWLQKQIKDKEKELAGKVFSDPEGFIKSK